MGDTRSLSTYDGEIYDVVHPGALQGDVEWYVERAVASGGPVIELGAGSGRVTIPIAERGMRVTALDLSDRMLARLETNLPPAPTRFAVV
jgi:ubiquinone/menaquinone biosynthesis C-methylase UbiE